MGDSVWLLERNHNTTFGVRYEEVTPERLQHRFPEGYYRTKSFTGSITAAEVRDFVFKETQRNYSYIFCNCKHLAFDFFWRVLRQYDDNASATFLTFCHEIEGSYHQQRLHRSTKTMGLQNTSE